MDRLKKNLNQLESISLEILSAQSMTEARRLEVYGTEGFHLLARQSWKLIIECKDLVMMMECPDETETFTGGRQIGADDEPI